MEEVLLRFSHLGENIFDLLDNKSLFKCRKICRTWSSFIADQKFPWIRVIHHPSAEHCNNSKFRPPKNRTIVLESLNKTNEPKEIKKNIPGWPSV